MAGFYSIVPVIILDILTRSFDPQLWHLLILLAAGLSVGLVNLVSQKTQANRVNPVPLP